MNLSVAAMTENNTVYCSFVGNQFFICDCGEAFACEKGLRQHLENDPHGVHTTTITEYKCGECFKIYATEQECMDHQEKEHVPYVEDHSYMADTPHVKVEPEEPVEVPQELVYDGQFIKEEPCFGEMETYYVEEVVGEDEHDPTVLGLVGTMEPYTPIRPRGRREAVQVTEGAKKKTKSYAQNNVVCEVCGKKYASAAALRYHQRVHSGVRPYQCTYCPKSFTMGLFLQIHIRTHTGERPYQCPHCPKAFSNKAALLRHDRVHTGIKPYACPRCGKTFTQSNSMKLHVHTVHLKMPAPYKSKRRKAESQARAARNKTVKQAEPQAIQVETVLLEPKLEADQDGCVYYCAAEGAAGDGVAYEVLPAGDGGVAYELVYE